MKAERYMQGRQRDILANMKFNANNLPIWGSKLLLCLLTSSSSSTAQ